ncbi:hypothetical protein [Limnobacter sp. MED105]|uniref:hypothetical protein n=1 Tax=Limnobacter sp. MED105 TaxID=391597 RepID=UPI000156C594|nr:hypothetical protein [Limnobacter sp. MED105]EDM82101.1 hypothetical protein LMED105_00100 [Limnobacter sp. MED105]
MKFYKNLSQKAQAFFLIAVGLGLLAVGTLLNSYIADRGQRVDPERPMFIKSEFLEMDIKALRRHFAQNKDEVAQIAQACAKQKESEVSLKVAEICKLAETMNHFRTHAERPSTFSSAGGTR